MGENKKKIRTKLRRKRLFSIISSSFNERWTMNGITNFYYTQCVFFFFWWNRKMDGSSSLDLNLISFFLFFFFKYEQANEIYNYWWHPRLLTVNKSWNVDRCALSWCIRSAVVVNINFFVVALFFCQKWKEKDIKLLSAST